MMSQQQIIARMLRLVGVVGALLALAACGSTGVATKHEEAPTRLIEPPSRSLGTEAKWESLFNGRNLDGWTAKFAQSNSGTNVLDTFRAEDGVLSVDYSNWTSFEGQFGHLVSERRFSRYILTLEYRFVGQQVPAPPTMAWAIRNNGVMLHSQSAQSMGRDQAFPVSIEAQLLGAENPVAQTTGNLCTPGTHVVIKGRLETEHCIYSNSRPFSKDQWITAEFEVLGSDRIRHFINGELVMEYQQPQYDPNSAEAVALQNGGSVLISDGHIALQAESHSTEFRNIRIHVLDGPQ